MYCIGWPRLGAIVAVWELTSVVAPDLLLQIAGVTQTKMRATCYHNTDKLGGTRPLHRVNKTKCAIRSGFAVAYYFKIVL